MINILINHQQLFCIYQEGITMERYFIFKISELSSEIEHYL